MKTLIIISLLLMYTHASEIKLIVGLDFGTSRSGWAWAYPGNANGVIAGTTDWPSRFPRFFYPKTATALLYDSTNNTIVNWGWQALDDFIDPDLNMTNHKLITNFKMALFDETLAKSLPMNVEHLIAEYMKRIVGLLYERVLDVQQERIKKDEIAYFVTVPAIWTDMHKAIMRQAVIRSGIVSQENAFSHLTLVLEPEAALLYATQGMKSRLALNNGDIVLIVDAGHGTVDLTTHEVLPGQQFKEVAIGGGGPYGGMYVDQNFLAKFASYYPRGEEMLHDMKQLRPDAYHEITVEWERMKSRDSGESTSVIIPLPTSTQLFLSEWLKAQNITLQRPSDIYKMKLSRTEIAALYEPIFSNIKTEIDKQINMAENAGKKINIMVLAGGFSESKFFRNFITETYADQLQVHTPADPAAAIVMGAVQYGLAPNSIVSRFTRYTYGIRYCARYRIPEDLAMCPITIHETNKEYCCERFFVFVRSNQSVGVDEVVKHEFIPFGSQQSRFDAEVLITTDENPQYSSTETSKMKLLVPLRGTGLKRPISAEFKFGTSEVLASFADVEGGSIKHATLSVDGSKAEQTTYPATPLTKETIAM
jgi:molecular chaperone DnaK (HSP70)